MGAKVGAGGSARQAPGAHEGDRTIDSLPMPLPSLIRRSVPLAAVALTLVVTACGAARSDRPRRGAGGRPAMPRGTQALSFDATQLYRQMGLLARGTPFPLLGRVTTLASRTPDTTQVIVAVSFPALALAFERQSDTRFRAAYVASIALTQGDRVIVSRERTHEVLVATFRETTRADESVFYQETLDVPPGTYTLTFAIRDESTQRIAEERLPIQVPALGDGGIGTPVPVLEGGVRLSRDSLPELIVAPAGTAVIGRDSIIPVYLEAYGGADRPPLRLLIRNETGRVLWSEPISLPQRSDLASGIINVPVARIGLGVGQISLLREGGADTASTYLFVGFGAGLPVATFDDMVFYLRLYASPARLTALREAAPETRPEAWSAFVRATDPNPQTAVHEDLATYFDRVARANARFGDEAGPGWQSDRGRVAIVLGEPDQVIEPQLNDMSRNRQQVWVYSAMNLQLTFLDQTGTGRWRLTQTSEVRFETEFRRRLK